MKCTNIEGRMCDQFGCPKPATCRTRVSGFLVNACKEHHACDKEVRK